MTAAPYPSLRILPPIYQYEYKTNLRAPSSQPSPSRQISKPFENTNEPKSRLIRLIVLIYQSLAHIPNNSRHTRIKVNQSLPQNNSGTSSGSIRGGSIRRSGSGRSISGSGGRTSSNSGSSGRSRAAVVRSAAAA